MIREFPIPSLTICRRPTLARCAGNKIRPIGALGRGGTITFGKQGRRGSNQPARRINENRRPAWRQIIMLLKRFLTSALACALIFVTSGCSSVATQEAQAATAPGVQSAQPNPEQLQQLVAPLALYPDELVAEVLAASTYPTEVVQANRWLQQHSILKDQQLATEVDKQPWDASVKALTEFPSVLANMDKKSFLDIVSRRRLLQSPAGGYGRRPGYAQA